MLLERWTSLVGPSGGVPILWSLGTFSMFIELKPETRDLRMPINWTLGACNGHIQAPALSMGAYGIGSVCVAWSISLSYQAAISPCSKASVFSSGGSSPRRFLPFLSPEGTGTGRLGCLVQASMMENDASTTPLFFIPSTSRAVIASPCPCWVLKYPDWSGRNPPPRALSRVPTSPGYVVL